MYTIHLNADEAKILKQILIECQLNLLRHANHETSGAIQTAIRGDAQLLNHIAEQLKSTNEVS